MFAFTYKKNCKLLDALEGNNKELFLKEELPPRGAEAKKKKKKLFVPNKNVNHQDVHKQSCSFVSELLIYTRNVGGET